MTAHSGAVKISADARVGGPLVLEAVNASTQIPLSGGTPAILTLQSWVPPPWGEAAGDTGTGGASLTPVTAIRVRSQREQPAPENNGIQSAKPEQKELLASCTFQMRKPSEVALTGAAAAATAAPMNYCSQWRQATNAIAEGDPTEEHPAPVIAVVGSKQVGKSSFARLLINSLLGRHASVAYIDTDCGQAEFGAPGDHQCWLWGTGVDADLHTCCFCPVYECSAGGVLVFLLRQQPPLPLSSGPCLSCCSCCCRYRCHGAYIASSTAFQSGGQKCPGCMPRRCSFSYHRQKPVDRAASHASFAGRAFSFHWRRLTTGVIR